MKKYLNLSVVYLGIGLILGVFFREFTKINGFTDKTILSALHGHALVLGFIFFLIVLILDKLFKISEVKYFTKWIVLYNISLSYVICTLLVRGIGQVLGSDLAGLNHIAGLGHGMLGISLIWFIIILYKRVE